MHENTRANFLATLAITGHVPTARKAAGIGQVALRDARKADPAFNAAVLAAAHRGKVRCHEIIHAALDETADAKLALAYLERQDRSAESIARQRQMAAQTAKLRAETAVLKGEQRDATVRVLFDWDDADDQDRAAPDAAAASDPAQHE